MTQASEQGTVATSNNRQQQHHQLQWAQEKPSSIAMDAINAIIVMRKSTLEMRAPLTQQGEPWKSASEPQDGPSDKRDKSAMRTS
jgi:hypothetical protein